MAAGMKQPGIGGGIFSNGARPNGGKNMPGNGQGQPGMMKDPKLMGQMGSKNPMMGGLPLGKQGSVLSDRSKPKVPL